MQKVAVVTDSSSCLPPEVAAQHGIEIVPIEMVFEGRVYRDGADGAGDFYRLLREAKRLPTTAAPSPGLFLEAFTRARKRAESILCITLPANLSSLHNSSQQAIGLAEEEMPGVRIVSMGAGPLRPGRGCWRWRPLGPPKRGLIWTGRQTW